MLQQGWTVQHLIIPYTHWTCVPNDVRNTYIGRVGGSGLVLTGGINETFGLTIYTCISVEYRRQLFFFLKKWISLVLTDALQLWLGRNFDFLNLHTPSETPHCNSVCHLWTPLGVVGCGPFIEVGSPKCFQLEDDDIPFPNPMESPS